MAYRVSLMSLSILGVLSMGATNCGGGGGGPNCPERSQESALMIVPGAGGPSLVVGSFSLTETDGLYYADVRPDPQFVALNMGVHPSAASPYVYVLHPELAPEWAYRTPTSDTPQGAVFERRLDDRAYRPVETVEVNALIFRPLADGTFEFVGRVEHSFSLDEAAFAAIGTGGGGGGGPDSCPRQ